MKIQVSIEGVTYEVAIQDLNARPVIVEVDGQVVEVYPEESGNAPAKVAAPAPKASPAVKPAAAKPKPAAAAPAAGASVLTSPLPGTIVSIDVKAGDAVKKGDGLLTLEAMKMKNVIRAEADGVIADVHVNQGDLVKHGQPLVSFKG
ncbi:MAG TPA: biotin/lipoyl-binding protein [Anaerolineaceae bacterium]|nr:biotin/lipoyl-binding protein [Chloroflexota bacterium]HNY83500.1 biotin/lipoyl-binding protein [Anaerolineaceae bacterium]